MDSDKRLNPWPIIGHEWAVRQLQVAVARGDVSHALLITGPASVGKYTLALTLAKAMLCEAETETRPCGICAVCRRVDSGNHTDLFLATPEEEGRGVKIEQIRELERFLSLTPNESAYKIAIITDFEKANPNAANALLKTLEEPPQYAHLILLASDADTLLPTIVSRSQHLPLRPLDVHTVEQGLIASWNVAPPQAQRLARLSGGRMGWAVQAITQSDHLQQMEEALQTMITLLRSDLPTRFETAGKIAENPTRLPQTLEYWRACWRDVLLLQTQSAEGLTYQEYHEELQGIARSTSVDATAHTLRALGDAQLALGSNANTRLLVETLLLDLPEL